MNNTHGDLLYRPDTSSVPRPDIMEHSNYQAPGGEVGWICPVCGRGLAPSTSYCPCNLTRNITYLNGGTTIKDISDHAIDCNSVPPEAHYTTSATNGEDWVKADTKLHCPAGALNF